jgi:hypothetical protein
MTPCGSFFISFSVSYIVCSQLSMLMKDERCMDNQKAQIIQDILASGMFNYLLNCKAYRTDVLIIKCMFKLFVKVKGKKLSL